MLRSLFALTLSFAFVPVALADAPPTDTPYQFALFNGPAAGSCLQTPSNLPLENDRVHQAQCELAGDNQMYVFETAVLGYRLRTAQSALCFDAPTGSAPHSYVAILAAKGLRGLSSRAAASETTANAMMMPR